MLSVVKTWGQRYFSDPQAVALLAILGAVFGLLLWMSHILMPILISIVITYVLQWICRGMEQRGVPRAVAVGSVYTGFLSIFSLLLFVVIPLAWHQLGRLFEEFPEKLAQLQVFTQQLPGKSLVKMPAVSMEQLMEKVLAHVPGFTGDWLSITIAHIPNLILILAYLFLIPFLVFFFLKDQQRILSWFGQFLPRERAFLQHIWDEVNQQLGNYIRGKFAEVFIVTVATYAAFMVMGFPYATLLAALVGLSVVVPYVGAVVVTIPVVLVALWEWGFSSHCFYALLLYGIVQALDANIVVPLLFSEAVNLHPVVIMIAIIVFGGWWGVWGVFFAIPLATLIRAIVSAWPSRSLR